MPDHGARKVCQGSLVCPDSREIVDQTACLGQRGCREGRENGASRARQGLRGHQELLFQHCPQSVNPARMVRRAIVATMGLMEYRGFRVNAAIQAHRAAREFLALQDPRAGMGSKVKKEASDWLVYLDWMGHQVHLDIPGLKVIQG